MSANDNARATLIHDSLGIRILTLADECLARGDEALAAVLSEMAEKHGAVTQSSLLTQAMYQLHSGHLASFWPIVDRAQALAPYDAETGRLSEMVARLACTYTLDSAAHVMEIRDAEGRESTSSGEDIGQCAMMKRC